MIESVTKVFELHGIFYSFANRICRAFCDGRP
jgi:hypothetical protein